VVSGLLLAKNMKMHSLISVCMIKEEKLFWVVFTRSVMISHDCVNAA